MTVRPILTWPDPILSARCEPVEDDQLDELIADMFDTMYAANGRGLAAPQIGVAQRLFVMDATWKEGDRTPVVMINPTIMAAERVEIVADEFCLSIPEIPVPVARYAAVTVQWSDATFDIHMDDFDGAEARIIQHEFDHLNGVVTFDRVAPNLRSQLEASYARVRA